MLKTRNHNRTGNVAVLICFIMVPLLGLVACAVDYGYLLYMKSDLQRVGDQAALAGAMELLPEEDGTQDYDKVRQKVKEFVAHNYNGEFVVLDDDIQIGKFDPATIYSSVNIEDVSGDSFKLADVVSVSLRRDSSANSSVSLFFARLIGSDSADVSITATSILQKGRFLVPGTEILPIGLSQDAWNALGDNEELSIYGDGRLEGSDGSSLPGNFGTVNVGPNSNSTSELNNQIDNGLSENDLQALYDNGSISSPDFIDSQSQVTVQGDPGLSSGMKHSLAREEGNIKLIPIYDSFTGNGANTKANIVTWGIVQLGSSSFNGSKKTRVNVTKLNSFYGLMGANKDLSDESGNMEGVYTSPALIQ